MHWKRFAAILYVETCYTMLLTVGFYELHVFRSR